MLHTLRPAPGSRSKAKRIARGNSGKGGTTGGRGTKGQQSRVGKGRRFGFEGGQTPLLRRQPKFHGFERPRRVHFEIVNLADLEEKLASGTYDADALRAARVTSTKRPVKLLGMGTLTKAFHLTVGGASASAKAAVEKAGGSLTIVSPVPAPAAPSAKAD